MVSFHDVDFERGRLNYSFAVNDNYILSYRRRNNFTRLDTRSLNKTEKAFFLNYEAIDELGRMQTMSMMHSAFWRKVRQTHTQIHNRAERKIRLL